VIKRFKKKKAPGPDNMENNLLKDFREVLVKPLEKLFNLILDEEEARRTKAWRKFWGLEKIFSSKLSRKAKMKLFEICVPVLRYGAETWALTGTQVNDLQKT